MTANPPPTLSGASVRDRLPEGVVENNPLPETELEYTPDIPVSVLAQTPMMQHAQKIRAAGNIFQEASKACAVLGDKIKLLQQSLEGVQQANLEAIQRRDEAKKEMLKLLTEDEAEGELHETIISDS